MINNLMQNDKIEKKNHKQIEEKKYKSTWVNSTNPPPRTLDLGKKKKSSKRRT
jgi:hypothetical protein